MRSLGLGSGVTASTGALSGNVASLTTLVASPALLLGALPRDVSLLTTVVTLADTAESTSGLSATESTTEAGLTSTTGWAVSGDVADTTTVLSSVGVFGARLPTHVTRPLGGSTVSSSTVTTSSTTAVLLSVTRLGAHSGLILASKIAQSSSTYNVSGLTTSVAFTSTTTGSATESSSTSGGALRTSGRDVSLLAASVTSLGLGGRAVLAQVSALATRVTGWDTRVRASRGNMAR
jgi:hypothetical protein